MAAITSKLKKLRSKYKTVKDSAKKSGNSRPKKPWKFLEKMDLIFKDNPTIDPPHLWDSSSNDHITDVYKESSQKMVGCLLVLLLCFYINNQNTFL